MRERERERERERLLIAMMAQRLMITKASNRRRILEKKKKMNKEGFHFTPWPFGLLSFSLRDLRGMYIELGHTEQGCTQSLF
jgi:hypothetical protein